MAEQITLLDEYISSATIEDKLADIVEQARSKYGYYKMHISGMYEMIKSARDSELYDILELRKAKDGSVGFYFDNQLYIKFLIKKEVVNATKEIYSELLKGKPAEWLKGNAAPKGGVSVQMSFSDEVSFFSNALDYLVKTVKPTHKFGCCSKYKECSAANRCLHENQFYSKGCYYRDNLENGMNFYSVRDSSGRK